MLPRPDVITLGMTASLSGRYAQQGSQALAGVRAWVEDTNRTGGVFPTRSVPQNQGGDGVAVRLTSYDDESDPLRCERLTERLIVEDRVDLLLGPYSSGLSLTAATVAERHRRVLWNHGGASESIHRRDLKWVVGILTPASRYFHGIIDLARNARPPAAGVAVVHSTAGAFPKDVASGAVEHARERGFHTVRRLAYAPGTTDFRPTLERLGPHPPDLILGVGRMEDDLRLAQQLVQEGIPTRQVGLVAASVATFKEVLGEAAEGFLGPSQWEPGPPGSAPPPDYGPPAETVLKRLERLRPRGADYVMAQAYAGCLVAQRCVESAGSLDNFALRRAAEALDFTTFYGRYKIDPPTGRQVGHEMVVVQWRRGEKAVVWAPESKGPDPPNDSG